MKALSMEGLLCAARGSVAGRLWKARSDEGRWRLVDNDAVVEYLGPGCLGYWVDLDKIQDAATCLDVIAQVSKKTWASNSDVGELVSIINLIIPIQEQLCSGGRSRARTCKNATLAWLEQG